jgi:hypothetical protein
LNKEARSRPNDARARRSRESLREALLTIMRSKAYADISVRDVTAQAGDIGAAETRELIATMTRVLDQGDPALSARAVCEFIGDRSALWTILLNSEATAVMRQAFIDEAPAVVEGRQRALPEFPIELSASFFIGSMFEILGWWLRQSPKPPASELAHYLEVLILQPTMASTLGARA